MVVHVGNKAALASDMVVHVGSLAIVASDMFGYGKCNFKNWTAIIEIVMVNVKILHNNAFHYVVMLQC